jgi:hypothetical protein
VRGGGIDPERDLLAGAAGAEPDPRQTPARPACGRNLPGLRPGTLWCWRRTASFGDRQ